VKPTRIYFIQAVTGGPIKIGIAENVKKRLHSHQTSSHVELVLLAHRPGTRSDEWRLHQKLATHRVRGEWFEPHEDVLTEIRAALLIDQSLPPAYAKRAKTDRQKELDAAATEFMGTTFAFVLRQTFGLEPHWKREIARLAGSSERSVTNWLDLKGLPATRCVINLARRREEVRTWFAMLMVASYVAHRCQVTEFEAVKMLVDRPDLQSRIWQRKANEEVDDAIDAAWAAFIEQNGGGA